MVLRQSALFLCSQPEAGNISLAKTVDRYNKKSNKEHRISARDRSFMTNVMKAPEIVFSLLESHFSRYRKEEAGDESCLRLRSKSSPFD